MDDQILQSRGIFTLHLWKLKRNKIKNKNKNKTMRLVAIYNLHGQKLHPLFSTPSLSPFEFLLFFLKVSQQ